MDIVAACMAAVRRAGLARRLARGRGRPHPRGCRQTRAARIWPARSCSPAMSPRPGPGWRRSTMAGATTRSTSATPETDEALPRLAAHVVATARTDERAHRRAARAQAIVLRRRAGGDRRGGCAGGRRRQPDAARDRGRPDDHRPCAGYRHAVELFPDDRTRRRRCRAASARVRRLRRQCRPKR